MTWLARVACTLLIVTTVATAAATAQSNPPSPTQDAERDGVTSLADRLSSLRFGWLNRSKEKEAPQQATAPPQRRAAAPERRAGAPMRVATAPARTAQPPVPAPASPKRRPQSQATQQPPRPKAPTESRPRSGFSSLRDRLPSLDPRDLLPQDLMSRNASNEPATKPRSAPPAAKATQSPTSSSVGSARARLMRDLRQRAAGQPRPQTPAPRVAERTTKPAPKKTVASGAQPVPLQKRAPARAGSVLSPKSTAPAKPSVASRPSPKESKRVEYDSAELRDELLGPSYAAKPKNPMRVATIKSGSPSSEASRKINKELAAEIARELAAEPGPTQPKVTAEPIGGGNLVALTPKSAADDPPASNADDKDSTLEAFAAGLAATKVGDRYAKPSPPVARATPKPTPQAAPVIDTEPIVIASDEPTLKVGSVAIEGTLPGVKPTEDRRRLTSRVPVVDATSAPLSTDESELLMSEKMPLIASRVNGPRQIVVGRTAEFEVVLANRGEAAADDLVARIRVPSWADVVSTDATIGSTAPAVDQGVEKLVEWRIDQFASSSSAKLMVKLIARKGRPIELGVDWTHAPVGGKTYVEVQEPKLELEIDGPEEVIFGDPQRYRLTLKNPGTGAAEEITLHLAPPGKSAVEEKPFKIGSLGAGKTKTVEIELTAREAGELGIRARATSAGGVNAAVEKKLFCRKPELEVDWRGPQRKYAGAESTYYFRVRNPGTADAKGVLFVVDLPAGFELQATSPGQSYNKTKRRLAWRVGTLRAGDDRYLEIRGVGSKAGVNQFAIAAATADRLIGDSVTAETSIVTVADLQLDVSDPKGPLPVGAEVVYEVRVKNRGSSSAEGVDIVALFSQGIEPHGVEGGEYTVSDGRVAISPIDRLAPGEEKLIRVRARAEQAGTHVFRAEVVCQALEIRLSEDEMTRFYVDEKVDMSDVARQARELDEFVYPR